MNKKIFKKLMLTLMCAFGISSSIKSMDMFCDGLPHSFFGPVATESLADVAADASGAQASVSQSLADVAADASGAQASVSQSLADVAADASGKAAGEVVKASVKQSLMGSSLSAVSYAKDSFVNAACYLANGALSGAAKMRVGASLFYNGTIESAKAHPYLTTAVAGLAAIGTCYAYKTYKNYKKLTGRVVAAKTCCTMGSNEKRCSNNVEKGTPNTIWTSQKINNETNITAVCAKCVQRAIDAKANLRYTIMVQASQSQAMNKQFEKLKNAAARAEWVDQWKSQVLEKVLTGCSYLPTKRTVGYVAAATAAAGLSLAAYRYGLPSMPSLPSKLAFWR